jgi:TonB family protein
MKPPLRLGLCVASFALAAAASAQRPPPLPPGSWNIDWGERRCSLIRRSASPPPKYFALQIVPGRYRPDLRVVSRSWPHRALSDPARLTISFGPQGWTVPGSIEVQRTHGGDAVVIFNASEDVREAFAAADSVRVARDGTTLLEMPLPGSGRALAALRECEESVMREWGIDAAAWAAVRTPPRGNLARFVTNNDYPASALRRHAQGTVVFRLHIDATGRVGDCAVVESSGDADLDATSCRVMRQRARLEPATGQDGSPIPVTFIGCITWRIFGG